MCVRDPVPVQPPLSEWDRSEDQAFPRKTFAREEPATSDREQRILGSFLRALLRALSVWPT